MPQSDFFVAFPHLTGSDLRSISVPPDNDLSLPADRYVFAEFYCNEVGCDCRRVTVAVLAERQHKRVAYINLGFDSDDAMAGPFLDPLNPQAPFARGLLTFFTDMINADPAYLARLHRHYVLFKEKCEGRPYAGAPFEQPGRVKRIAAAQAPGFPSADLPMRLPGPPIRREPRVGRNAPCPCGSGKKYKQCCMGKPPTAGSGLPAPAPPAGTRAPPQARASKATTQIKAQNDAQSAQSLVTQVMTWRRDPRHRAPWGPAVVRALETQQDLAPALLRLLLTDFAPDGRQQTPPEDYGACLALLEEALTQIRYAIERRRPWAIAMAEQIQRQMAKEAFRPEVDVRVQQDLLEALHSAKLELHPCLRDQAVAVAEYYARFRGAKGGPGLDTLLERLVQDLKPGDPFDLIDPILAEMAVMPRDGQVLLATGMLASSQPLLRDLAVLLVLHPDAAVRPGLADAFAHPDLVRQISPLGLRRLIGLRNWLPESERPALDALIRAVRLAGVASAPLPPTAAVAVYASAFDGSGAQGAWFFAKDGCRHRLEGVLVKQGLGIREAWGEGGLLKRDVDAKIAALTGDMAALKLHRDYLERLVAHFIALGLESGKPPTPHLVSVQERLGGDYWRPGRIDPAAEIAALMATAPQAFTPARTRQALDQAGDWPAHRDFARSWFEDDAAIDDLLRKRLGRPADWPSRLPAATQAILAEVLEARRALWTERLLWMALWARAAATRPEVPWQDFLIQAHALQAGRPLAQIPLMEAIAQRSVQAAWRRAGAR